MCATATSCRPGSNSRRKSGKDVAGLFLGRQSAAHDLVLRERNSPIPVGRDKPARAKTMKSGY